LGLYQDLLGPCCNNMRIQDEVSVFCGQGRFVPLISLYGFPHQKERPGRSVVLSQSLIAWQCGNPAADKGLENDLS